MKHRIKGFCAILIAGVLFMGCNSEKDYAFQGQNEDAASLGEIVLGVREEGSGTRYEFENFLGISMSDGEQDLYADMPQAAIRESGEDMAAFIAQNDNSIGYLSFWQTGELKALAIDGIVCTRESIAAGVYPVTRDFSVAWTEESNALRDDFIRYINGAGQEIVAEKYVAVNKPGTFLYDETAQGTLVISGSSSVAPLMEDLAAAYMDINKNAEIEIQVSDSTQGLNSLLSGGCDLAMVSRQLKEYESELVEVNVFAKDGIAIVVDAGNPINQLTTEQLCGIFTGKITGWKEIK
ncbi:MAG: substrate-binding domain-containing protein [Lachnospiraceae bacterium]